MSADIAAIETRAGAIETRIADLLAKGGTMDDHAKTLRDAEEMIADLRIRYVAA